MRFFVTYSVTKLANPFRHALIFLSYWGGEGQKILVHTACGFYGAQSTATDGIAYKIKSWLKIPIDLQGNHGHWLREEIRYMDLGYGLEGMTFEVSLEKFLAIKRDLRNMFIDEQNAVSEAEQCFEEKGVKSTSYDIYQYELNLAKTENRKPRLNPFDFHVKPTIDWLPLTFNDSHTCKTMAISALKKIDIEKQYIDYLTNGGKANVLPIQGGALLPVSFHSRGPLHQKMKDNKISFFRDWKDKGTELYWTYPPQMLVTNSQILKDQFCYPEECRVEVEDVVVKLQKMEKIFTDENKLNECVELVENIRELYEYFSFPRKFNESEFFSHLKKIKEFMNFLYFAMCDKWDDETEVCSQVLFLSESAQENLCEVMGWSYSPWLEDLKANQF